MDSIENIDFEEDNYLNEASAEKRAKRGMNSIIILYIHLGKFIFQPYNQSGNWCGSILSAYKNNLKNFNTKAAINNISEDNLEDCWQEALKQISIDTGINKDKLPQSYPVMFTLDNIIDKNFIINFIKTYAITNDAINWITNSENIKKFK